MTNRARVAHGAAVLILLAGCGEDSTAPEAQPPSLPAVESMVIDLETFPGSGSGQAAAVARTSHLTHHDVAALAVAHASAIVSAHLLVPVAAWRAARLQAPTLEDGEWHWRFETVVLTVTYSGDLVAFVEDGEAGFEMRLSSSAGPSDVLWYTGRAFIGGTTGVWEFFDPTEPGPVIARIDWAHPGSATWLLGFGLLEGANAGDLLSYTAEGPSRTMTFHDASESVTSEIYWDTVTRLGYVESPGYNDGERACWSALLQNVTCP